MSKYTQISDEVVGAFVLTMNIVKDSTFPIAVKNELVKACGAMYMLDAEVTTFTEKDFIAIVNLQKVIDYNEFLREQQTKNKKK
jgi:hypothetical protein